MKRREMETVKAHVTITVTTRERVEIPLISKELLELAPTALAWELWEKGIKENCEVGVLVSEVPEGVRVRKPTGEQEYLRAQDDWFRRTTGLEEERVLMIADGYRMNLMEGHEIVIAQLSDLYGCQWDLVAEELEEILYPQ